MDHLKITTTFSTLHLSDPYLVALPKGDICLAVSTGPTFAARCCSPLLLKKHVLALALVFRPRSLLSFCCYDVISTGAFWELSCLASVVLCCSICFLKPA